jgi:hypothetical protein
MAATWQQVRPASHDRGSNDSGSGVSHGMRLEHNQRMD